jgi:hypothetical protein
MQIVAFPGPGAWLQEIFFGNAAMRREDQNIAFPVSG